MAQLELIFILLVLFQVKHFICDYPLQNAYMLGKFKKEGWILPLLSHSAVHAFTTFMIALYFANIKLAIALGLLDLIIHSIMDRIKASPKLLGRFKPEQPYFWWALGFDQMVHHLTHYLLIFLIIKGA